MGFFKRMAPAICVVVLLIGAVWAYQKWKPSSAPVPAGSAEVYSTRGRIEQLPGTSRAAMLQIHHERIPEFKDRDGKVVGMNAMVMPFKPAPGISIEGFRVGDEIRFTFEHRWGEPPLITVIEKIDAAPK
jgi:Cu/Ag efflux protein CusF